MGETSQNDVLQLADLLLYRGADARVAVTEEVDPPGADRIDVAVALKVVQPNPFAPFDGDHRKGFMVLHLGAGVPDGFEVPCDQIGIAHCYLLSALGGSN